MFWRVEFPTARSFPYGTTAHSNLTFLFDGKSDRMHEDAKICNFVTFGHTGREVMVHVSLLPSCALGLFAGIWWL